MAEHKSVPAKLLQRIEAVTNKRARVVLDTIVKKGSISTTELKDAGYDHPPRAARDVVELGIALKRIKAKRADGQMIAAYIFDERELDPSKTVRIVLPKKERDAIIERKGRRCNLCGATHNIQLDHRIPYEVAGETQREDEDPYQLLDGACNRKKSWGCEHCENWLKTKNIDICRSSYWANPESYIHVAMQQERRIELVWIGDEASEFEQIERKARRNNRSVSDEIKAALKQK